MKSHYRRRWYVLVVAVFYFFAYSLASMSYLRISLSSGPVFISPILQLITGTLAISGAAYLLWPLIGNMIMLLATLAAFAHSVVLGRPSDAEFFLFVVCVLLPPLVIHVLRREDSDNKVMNPTC